MQQLRLPIARLFPDISGLYRRETVSWVLGSSSRTGSSQLISNRLLHARRRLLIPPRLVIASSFTPRSSFTQAGQDMVRGSNLTSTLYPIDKE